MELIGPTQYVRCLLYTHKTCVPCKRVEYSNTDGRLIKQLIKARELGSETRRLSFGKNCSTHRREGEEREKGLRGGRKRISAIGQECVKICPLPATPATNTNTPPIPPPPFPVPLLRSYFHSSEKCLEIESSRVQSRNSFTERCSQDV